jgi:Asp-tRNA(Asn)/Glu-tRNA(Gln) amidotransferase A subunit family amidase
MKLSSALTLAGALLLSVGANAQETEQKLTKESVSAAEPIIRMEFTDAERDSMMENLEENATAYDHLHALTILNSVPPAMSFNPIPVGFEFEKTRKPFKGSKQEKVRRPSNLDDAAFWSISRLAGLIRTRQVTSVELTEMYLARLKKYGPKLQCVITLTEERAMEEARQADREIRAGKYRGPLHGIPYGVKDLLSTKTYGTTWGAMPYKDQVIDEDATVVNSLKDAGGVLVAKLTLGALAWGDVWYGGMTRNPWNYEQGSSGSSAGPASATSAGLVAFAIGSETYGSIVSPSTRCGVTGLRPTYGRVSRTGAMALSWSMDKLGPICRTVEDCAIVLNAIIGPDGTDQTLYDLPFNYDPKVDFKKLRIGYLKSEFDSVRSNKENSDAVLEVLKRLGVTLIPITLPDRVPVDDLSIILSAEAAAAFDDLTRSGRDDLLVRQIKNAWPNSFRSSRFIPAVEYLQANRARYLLIQDMQQLMKTVDLYVTPSFGTNLLLTNLTGHPCVVLPNGFNKQGSPTSISFVGRLFGEATLLAVAKKYQDATDFHLKHPTLQE